MGHLRIKANKCGYKEKKQFINGINEIIRELTAIKKTNKITNEQILAWPRTVPKMAQK